MPLYHNPFELRNPVGNGLHNDPDDVSAVERQMRRRGYYPREETGYITRALDDGIKRYQRDKGLRVDGRLYPGGETEMSLNAQLAAAPKREEAEKPQTEIGFGKGVSGTLPPIPPRKPERPEPTKPITSPCDAYAVAVTSAQAKVMQMEQALTAATNRKASLEAQLSEAQSARNDTFVDKAKEWVEEKAVTWGSGRIMGGILGAAAATAGFAAGPATAIGLTGGYLGKLAAEEIEKKADDRLDNQKSDAELAVDSEKNKARLSALEKQIEQVDTLIATLTTQRDAAAEALETAEGRLQQCQQQHKNG